MTTFVFPLFYFLKLSYGFLGFFGFGGVLLYGLGAKNFGLLHNKYDRICLGG